MKTKDELIKHLEEEIEYHKDTIASGDVDNSSELAREEIMKLRKFIKWVEPREYLDL